MGMTMTIENGFKDAGFSVQSYIKCRVVGQLAPRGKKYCSLACSEDHTNQNKQGARYDGGRPPYQYRVDKNEQNNDLQEFFKETALITWPTTFTALGQSVQVISLISLSSAILFSINTILSQVGKYLFD